MTNQMPERIYVAYGGTVFDKPVYIALNNSTDAKNPESYHEYHRADLAQKTVTLLRIMVDAINAGQIDSPEIQGKPEHGILSHKWHEEWLYDAEKALIQSGIVKVKVKD